ncbi:hypothetical protein EJ03DRAFT_87842 [Teratosphaeria nubilosa]|uniref:Uncharacterized protein n=1 Tax=Teratosphaeria nubilosa TaxID=161662 RepID=A0A6G1LB04_9PEZI|nr:hypothetical protein EJ03DRAFT_87842 [Teratosphaeria nubilosa]
MFAVRQNIPARHKDELVTVMLTIQNEFVAGLELLFALGTPPSAIKILAQRAGGREGLPSTFSVESLRTYTVKTFLDGVKTVLKSGCEECVTLPLNGEAQLPLYTLITSLRCAGLDDMGKATFCYQYLSLWKNGGDDRDTSAQVLDRTERSFRVALAQSQGRRGDR